MAKVDEVYINAHHLFKYFVPYVKRDFIVVKKSTDNFCGTILVFTNL